MPVEFPVVALAHNHAPAAVPDTVVALEVFVHEPAQKLARVSKLEHDEGPELVRQPRIGMHGALETVHHDLAGFRRLRGVLLVALLLDTPPVLHFLVFLRVENGEQPVELFMDRAHGGREVVNFVLDAGCGLDFFYALHFVYVWQISFKTIASHTCVRKMLHPH